MIANCAKAINEVTIDEQSCDHEHHDYLLPYYNGNERLKLCYSKIITKYQGSDRANATRVNMEKLNEYVSTNSEAPSEFFTGGTPGVLSVNDYDEDTWTTRLFYGLRNGIKDIYMPISEVNVHPWEEERYL